MVEGVISGKRKFSFSRLPRKIAFPKFLLCLLAFGLFASGCAKDAQSFRHPEADLSSINRVAVIPFENLSTSQFAGEKVSMVYLSELLSDMDIDVVEPGEVARVLQADGGVAKDKLGQAEVKSLGAALKADTLIFGAVQEYGTVRVRNENYPVVSISVRWVDAQTGTIIFMGSVSEEGSPTIPIIDVGEEQMFPVLTRRACRKLVHMVR
jgi:hypothetical protein